MISKPKCVLEPQSIEFLGFSVNSVEQELSLPAGKVKIRAEAQHLLEGNQITAGKLSQLLGRLQAANRAVPLAPLFYRKLQQALQRTLEQSDQDYSAQLILSMGEQEELQWWLDHLSSWNGRTVMTEKPSLVMESDASAQGWRASCKRMQTGGPWSPEEKQGHINCLEALAAFHAVKCFVRDMKSITVLLGMDNTTAVALASFPGAEKGEGEKEHLVSTVCACALISKNSWTTLSLAGISVTLNSVRLPIFTVWKMHTTTTLCVNGDEGTIKALSFSVARMIHAFVHSS